ncbi:MAG: tRNA pseudouridine(38-40) synthase TruA [Bacteroidota bacterium]|jgi:tRNA pseudouridine38-40 synthase|nr:tRNA pseudouridine(38-40) synthase TruA [Bacteroidota bacterium]
MATHIHDSSDESSRRNSDPSPQGDPAVSSVPGSHKRFRILLEYDGTDFLGWQLQARGRTVQGEIEAALRRLFGAALRVHGAGRTDSGVHALGQVAHFDLDTRLDAPTMGKALNAELPDDIVVHDTGIVESEFHSRFSASSRSYTYTIVHHRVAIDRRRMWALHTPLAHDDIRVAVESLRGTHDFRAFAKHVPDMPHHWCHVFSASWDTDGDITRFRITANRFLQGMVRCLVGSLVHVGRRRISPDDFHAILASRDRRRAPMLAPAHGLVLTGVAYDVDERAVVRAIMEDLRMDLHREE